VYANPPQIHFDSDAHNTWFRVLQAQALRYNFPNGFRVGRGIGVILFDAVDHRQI
jgi:hypothetical protein